MKQPAQRACKFLFYFLFAGVVSAQTAPCMRINTVESWRDCPPQTNQDATVNLSNPVVSFQIMEPGYDLDPNPGARYKGFWIYGDGAFDWFEYGDVAEDAATLYRTHTYPGAGTYEPTVVLSERKSNTSPPKKPKRTISIQNLNGTPSGGGNFTPVIPAGKSMHIFNHDPNRPHYPTVFVVSTNSKKPFQQIYLFYNSTQDQAGRKNSITIHNQVDFVHFPHYLQGAISSSYVNKPIADFPAELSYLQRVLPAQFANYLRFSFDSKGAGIFSGGKMRTSNNAPNNNEAALPEEIRVFPALTTQWDQQWIETPNNMLPRGHYLAVTVGASPADLIPNPDQPNSINPLFQEVLQLFPDLDANTLQCGPESYILGIATADVDMVASIDPNGLKILEICPGEDGKFKVKIRMEVCNEGYMHEQNFNVRLLDHTGRISDPLFYSWPTAAPTLDSSANNTWYYTWNVFLDGLPLPNETVASRNQQRTLCETAEFEVVTDWAGVQQLARGEGLELCVQFLHAREECTKNYMLNPVNLSEKCGYACPAMAGKCISQGWSCTLLLSCLIVVLSLILLWWLFSGRRDHTSGA